MGLFRKALFFLYTEALFLKDKQDAKNCIMALEKTQSRHYFVVYVLLLALIHRSLDAQLRLKRSRWHRNVLKTVIVIQLCLKFKNSGIKRIEEHRMVTCSRNRTYYAPACSLVRCYIKEIEEGLFEIFIR